LLTLCEHHQSVNPPTISQVLPLLSIMLPSCPETLSEAMQRRRSRQERPILESGLEVRREGRVTVGMHRKAVLGPARTEQCLNL